MSLSILLGLGFTWLVAPVCLFLAAARWTEDLREERWTLLGLCWGFAPAVISRILTWTLYVFGGASDALYISVIGAVFAGLGLYGLPRAELLRNILADGASWIRRWGWVLLAATAIAGSVFVFVVSGQWGTLTRIYVWAIGAWDPNQLNWSAVMPRFAAAILLVFVVAGSLIAVAQQRETNPKPWRISQSAVAALIIGALGAILALAFCLIVGLPLFENDALQYFHVAGLLYQAHSLAQYPVMPAALDGTYAASAHPLGQYGLLIWGMMVAGGPIPGPGKLLVFGSSLATLIGIAIALRRHGAIAISSAMLLLVTTPGYFTQLLGCGIDPPRLALVLLAILALVWASRQGSWAAWSCAGVAAGLALNSHSESLLPVAIIVAAAAFLERTRRWRERIAAVLLMGGIAVAVGGERYILNAITFGTPVYNDLAIWRLVPSLHYREWRSSLVPPHGWLGLLVKGPLLGFSNWYMFAFTWWLALLAIVLRWRTLLSDVTLRALTGIGIGTFALIALYLSLPATGEVLIGNYRYVMCLQPVVAVLAGWFLAKTVEPRAHPV